MNLRLPNLLERAGADVPHDSSLDLAAGFGSVLEQVHVALGGDGPRSTWVARLGQVLSLMASDGHACVALDELQARLGHLPGAAAELNAHDLAIVLADSPAIGAPSKQQLAAPSAAVIFERQRFYLQRYWRYEVRLAEQLSDMDRAAPCADPARLQEVLAEYFNGGQHIDWQLVAAATVLLRQLTLVTGGPGTGKTTTVARVLAVLLRLAPDSRIALAAPTGKAALRLQQAIAKEIAGMSATQLALEPVALKTLATLNAQTLHRLLGGRPGDARYRYHRDRPLPFDLVVVDEASMLDLALAARLVDAMAPHARLVLLGDADQLSSVETGTVFAELASLERRQGAFATTLAEVCQVDAGLLDVAAGPPSSLGNAVVRLKRSYRYRQDGVLGQLAEAVRTGDRDQVDAMLAGQHEALHFHDISNLSDSGALAAQLITGFEPLFTSIQERRSAADVLAQVGAYGVLCALRRGPLGALRINAALAHLAALRLGANTQDIWFEGRVVMVTRNDPMLGLYNGDVGVALLSGNALMVHFLSQGAETRALAPARLVEVETAFALTVHKAQGSEFDRVDVILPQPESPLASRELLYTAITRARHGVTLWGDQRTLGIATARPTRRHSALAERLRDHSD